MMTIALWLKNSPLPRLEARMLLQKATGLSRTQLLSHDQEVLSTEALSCLSIWQKSRLEGVPMAYLIGSREFFGREFKVSTDILIPRVETEHLVEAVLERLPAKRAARLWDLGTGSGIIAITLKLERALSLVFASDISSAALAIAAENAQTLGAEVVFLEGSWFEALPKESKQQTFDFIISNPPYISLTDQHLKVGDVRFEPMSALTDFADGLSALAYLCQQAPTYLNRGGYLLLEHGYDQADAVQALLRQNRFQQIETLLDLAHLPRVTLGCWQG